jgi:hypothetical protein
MLTNREFPIDVDGKPVDISKLAPKAAAVILVRLMLQMGKKRIEIRNDRGSFKIVREQFDNIVDVINAFEQTGFPRDEFGHLMMEAAADIDLSFPDMLLLYVTVRECMQTLQSILKIVDPSKTKPIPN